LSQRMTKARFARAGKPKPQEPTPHDRQAKDLLRNAQVATAVVPDPYGQPGEKITVLRSIRDDILAEMLARKEIDQAQFDAGRRYEHYAEQAEIGNVKAIDPRKEAVDGGGGYEGITDRQIDAVRALSEAARVLGARGEALVREVLVLRKRFSHMGLPDRAVGQARVRFFTYLEILAEFWGCVTPQRRGRP
jgi:hypothetical protein